MINYIKWLQNKFNIKWSYKSWFYIIIAILIGLLIISIITSLYVMVVPLWLITIIWGCTGQDYLEEKEHIQR